jgi:hypothetical protein
MTTNVWINGFKQWAALAAAIGAVGLGVVVGAPRARPRASSESAERAFQAQAALPGQKARAPSERAAKGRRGVASATEQAEPYGEEVSTEERLARDHARARTLARANARITDIETRFTEESADARWAPQFSAHLRGLLGKEGVETAAIRRVECRSTLCRVELDVKDGAPVAKLLQVSAQLQTQYWVRPAEPPVTALDVFVARPGLKDADFPAHGI